ncbi:MAG: hypothetical protein MJ178_06660 [Treponemataceae bacterium]|nr:hypothetical protein [Treponemataceae bacterium]
MKKIICLCTVLCAALFVFTSCASNAPAADTAVTAAPALAAKPFTHDMYADAPESVRDAIARCDALIADAKYRSARSALGVAEDLGKDEDYLLYKNVEVITNYFCFSMMHTMFDIQDFNSVEELMEYRHNISYGDQDMSFSLTFGEGPEAWIDEYEAEYGKTPRTALARAQYYFDVSLRYGDQWLRPYVELRELAYENYKEAIEGGFYDMIALERFGESALYTAHDEDAYAAYKDLTEYVPDHGNYWFNLAVSCANMKANYEEGIAACRMAIQYPEENIGYQMDYYRLLSDLYFKSGDLKGAEQALIDLTVAMPDQPYAFICLGEFYFEKMDNVSKGSNALYAAIETEFVNYDEYTTLWDLGSYLFGIDHEEVVFDLTKKAKKLFAGNDSAVGFAWWVETQAYYSMDNLPKAREAAKEAKDLFQKAGPTELYSAAFRFLSQTGR